MAEAGSDVIFLAGRLVARDDLRGLRDLAGRLRGLGHRSRVLCLAAAPDHALPELVECPALGRRWLLSWAVKALELVEEGGRPRVLHVLGQGMAEAAIEVAERWRIPYLLAVDEFPRGHCRLRLSRKWCKGLVATDAELAEALTRDLGVPHRLIRLIPRGIGETGRPEVPPAAIPRAPRVPVVGAAGPLVPGSGFPTFLAAAKKVIEAGIDAEFLIAGHGEDEADLRRRADRLRIADRLTFADDLAVGLTFWDVLDVYCQTSVVPTVGRSLALAMAHGVPSIASDVEGLRARVVEGLTGLLVPRGDASALALAMIALLSDREAARRIGDSGREASLGGHDPEAEARRLSEIYGKVAEASASGLEGRSGSDEADVASGRAG